MTMDAPMRLKTTPTSSCGHFTGNTLVNPAGRERSIIKALPLMPQPPEAAMLECGFSWQRAFQSSIHETEPDTVESKIGLARLAILERLVSPASMDRKEEDALFEALDGLRAFDWQRLLHQEELISSGRLSFHQ